MRLCRRLNFREVGDAFIMAHVYKSKIHSGAWMKINIKTVSTFIAVAVLAIPQAGAQVVAGDQLKKLIPTTYFYAGRSAPVQVRNSGGVKNSAGKFTLAGLVDTSGYSTAIAEKYQGFLITETKVTFEGAALETGAYGFGFEDGKFLVMNVAGNDVFAIPAQKDDQLKHPVPLQFQKSDAGYRLYVGRNFITFKVD
jgi:hypothetical protein